MRPWSFPRGRARGTTETPDLAVGQSSRVEPAGDLPVLIREFRSAGWQFDSPNLIVVRTGFDDGLGGANTNHDANRLTLHRITQFRQERRSAVP